MNRKPVVVRWIKHFSDSQSIVGAWSPGDFVSWRNTRLDNMTSVQLQTKFENKLYTLSAKDIGKKIAKFWYEDDYEYYMSTGQSIMVARRIMIETEPNKWLCLEIGLSDDRVKSYLKEKEIKDA